MIKLVVIGIGNYNKSNTEKNKLGEKIANAKLGMRRVNMDEYFRYDRQCADGSVCFGHAARAVLVE